MKKFSQKYSLEIKNRFYRVFQKIEDQGFFTLNSGLGLLAKKIF